MHTTYRSTQHTEVRRKHGSPGTELPQEPNLDALQQQGMLLTHEPSLQPLVLYFLNDSFPLASMCESWLLIIYNE